MSLFAPTKRKGGLFDGLSLAQDSPNAPQPDAQAAMTPQPAMHQQPDLLAAYLAQTQTQPKHASLWDALKLAGATVHQATGYDDNAISTSENAINAANADPSDTAGAVTRRRQAADGGAPQRAPRSEAERRALLEMARQLGFSPREQLEFLVDPEGKVKTMMDRENGFHDIGNGGAGVWGDPNAGGSVMRNPLVGVENGEGFAAGPSGMQDLGSLGVSQSQQAKIDADAAALREREQYHETMGAAATERARKYNTGHGGGGGGAAGGLPPGVRMGW